MSDDRGGFAARLRVCRCGGQAAAGYLQQALMGYRELGSQDGEADVLNGLGEVFLATGCLTDAHANHDAALRLAAQISQKHEQARAHHGLARTHQASGEPGKARHHWQEALALYTDLGAPEADHARAQLTAPAAG